MLIACLLKRNGNSLQTDVGITRKASRIIFKKRSVFSLLIKEKTLNPSCVHVQNKEISHVAEKKRHKGLKGNEIRFLLKDALLILITKAATADNREI